jgi:hypothetical protein
VQCKISRTVQEHGHLHPEASRRKWSKYPPWKHEANICGHRRTAPSIFSESLKQDSIALDLSHVEIA